MKQYLAEFFGSLVFMYVILAIGHPLAIGAALGVVNMVTAPISGGHVNPAVSVVMTVMGKLPNGKLLPYIGAQLVGGLVALTLHKRLKF